MSYRETIVHCMPNTVTCTFAGKMEGKKHDCVQDLLWFGEQFNLVK